jgi:hypothetical protein
MRLRQIDGKALAQADLFNFWFRQPQIPGFRKYAAHTGAPRFDQVEFLENAADDRISNSGITQARSSRSQILRRAYL